MILPEQTNTFNVYPVRCEALAKEGGSLHCATANLRLPRRKPRESSHDP